FCRLTSDGCGHSSPSLAATRPVGLSNVTLSRYAGPRPSGRVGAVSPSGTVSPSGPAGPPAVSLPGTAGQPGTVCRSDGPRVAGVSGAPDMADGSDPVMVTGSVNSASRLSP